jgi:hypothetical protein
MKLLSRLILILLLLLPGLAAAALPANFIADFKPLDGMIIMPSGDEYLIDLDVTDGLREGDLLTLLAPGELIIHPVSKAVLGRLESVTGYLQVTRVKSGYSYVRVLNSETPVEKGAKIRRFEQVPSRFVDQQGDGGPLRENLVEELPQLTWLSEADSTEPLLIFTLENNTLAVTSQSGKMLHSYPLAGGRPIASPMPQYRDPIAAGPKKEPKLLDRAVQGVLETIGSTGGAGSHTDAARIRQDLARSEGVWTSPSLAGAPVGLAVADFDHDQQQEVAVAFSKSLQFARVVDGNYKLLQEIKLPVGIFLLALDSIDLDGDGARELYLTAVRDNRPVSLMVEYADQEYRIIKREIPWLLRVVDLPEEGPTLLGQELTEDSRNFSGLPFRVLRAGDKLQKGSPLALPAEASVYGFVPFQDKNGIQLFAYLSDDDKLRVSNAEGTVLWEAAGHFGGSNACLKFEQTKAETYLPPLCLRSRLLVNPAGELLVPQNDGQRYFKRFPTYDASRLLAMAWGGHALTESWRTLQQEGYLADTVLADIDNDGLTELAMVIQFKYEGILGDARSAIVSFELAQ